MEVKVSHAKVKFIENGEKKILSIEDIVEFHDKPPKDKDDFRRNKVYTCWYKDEKYPELTKYGIQIGKLYGKILLNIFKYFVFYINVLTNLSFFNIIYLYHSYYYLQNRDKKMTRESYLVN